MAQMYRTPAYMYRKNGYTIYGEEQWTPRVLIFVAVVKFLDVATATPIRSEASASHGRAKEDTAKVVVLVNKWVQMTEDFRIDLFGLTLMVQGVYPRYDLFGNLDHYQLSLERVEVPAANADGDH